MDLDTRPGPDREGRRYEMAAAIVAKSERLAVSKTEAARMLGVSAEFFDQHVAPEVVAVRRGRRVLYPVGALALWLCDCAELPGSDGNGSPK